MASLLLAVALSSGCKGGTAPASSPTPSPVAPGATPSPSAVVNMEGTWSGTLESSNFPTRSISLMVFQAGNCVDGAWTTVPPDWAGAISGYAGTASFAGSISFEGAPGCTAAATVSGDVAADKMTLTTGGFPSGNCPQGTPQAVVIRLQRD